MRLFFVVCFLKTIWLKHHCSFQRKCRLTLSDDCLKKHNVASFFHCLKTELIMKYNLINYCNSSSHFHGKGRSTRNGILGDHHIFLTLFYFFLLFDSLLPIPPSLTTFVMWPSILDFLPLNIKTNIVSDVQPQEDFWEILWFVS